MKKVRVIIKIKSTGVIIFSHLYSPRDAAQIKKNYEQQPNLVAAYIVEIEKP
jgi:hypothetical protein